MTALSAFIQRLVEHFAPEQIILFGFLARGEARWDSDTDFPLDLHLRRPEEIAPRYCWGDPSIREAMDHGELLCGEPNRSTLEHAGIPLSMRNPVVDEWIARAERH